MKTKQLLQNLAKERPVGTLNNHAVIDLLKTEFINMGYEVSALPFECLVWEKGISEMKIGDLTLELEASPCSKAFNGEGEAIIIASLEALQTEELKDKIVILCNFASERPVQPKDYPFYYPEEDRAIISRLESQKPKAVIALTGKATLCGLNPFPMFTDGNLTIPTGYLSETKGALIKEALHQNNRISLTIESKTIQKESSQLIAHKKGVVPKGKIIVCAHMDTQYNTMGALDNATGVAVLIRTMEQLKEVMCPLAIDFVPFNTEEYFGANGELKYLEYLQAQKEEVSLVINIDSPCHRGSQTAVSYYNISENQEALIHEVMQNHTKVEKGEPWYAGDHCIFAFNGISCLAISSSDLLEGALEYVHTPKDTLETIDEKLVDLTADFLVELIKAWA